MHFAKYWALGSSGKYKCWRSSDVSESDARAKAAADAVTIGGKVDGGVRWKYGYPDRAVREEVLQQAPGGAGPEIAWAVTRNAYGCDVLNTSRMVFVDVDHDGPPQRHLDQAQRWADSHPGWCFRAYKTKAGLRLLATHALVRPDDPLVVKDLFPALGTDALYARLCKTQGSYRARLTPKPWRCGINAPRMRWPWSDAGAEERFRDWHGQYQQASGKYATCELVAEIGPHSVLPEIAPVIALHDRATRVGSGLPLA
jgi:hypothetical protein